MFPFMEWYLRETTNIFIILEQELLNLEKSRNVSLQFDGKKQKKQKKKEKKEKEKEKESNGAVSVDDQAGTSGAGGKEKCLLM